MSTKLTPQQACEMKSLMQIAERARLQAQLVDTRRMLELAGNHPVMSVAFSEREKELVAQITVFDSRVMKQPKSQ